MMHVGSTIGMHRLTDFQRALKLWHFEERRVGAIEQELCGGAPDVSFLQDVFQANPAPVGIPNTAGSPLGAGDVGLEKAAAVPARRATQARIPDEWKPRQRGDPENLPE